MVIEWLARYGRQPRPRRRRRPHAHRRGGRRLALFAIWIAARARHAEKTFGYYRVEILATVVNALLLLGVAVVILIEAYQRVLAPREVLGRR